MSFGETHAKPLKDKKQCIYVRRYPAFVSRGLDFVSSFPVAYGPKGRLLLTLLLRALDLALAVAFALPSESEIQCRSASSRWTPVQ